MAAVPGSGKGNIPLLRQGYKSFVGMGHKAVASDFEANIEGAEHISPLLQNIQVPMFGREPIETYGPYGVMFQQQSGPKTSGETTFTFAETINGPVYEFFRKAAAEKRYMNMDLALKCEELPDGVSPLKFTLFDVWCAVDPVDLSREDRTGIVQVAGTLYYNWAEYLQGTGA